MSIPHLTSEISEATLVSRIIKMKQGKVKKVVQTVQVIKNLTK